MDALERYKKQLPKIRRSGHRMWVIYVRVRGDKKFFPWRGRIFIYAYPHRRDAEKALSVARDLYGTRNAYLQKVGPIS